MIKIALKHFIYEKCIDTIFNAINRNFAVIKKETKVPLSPFFTHVLNDGSIHAPNSREHMQYRNAFDTYTSYVYNKGWFVDSYAISDLEILALKLMKRILADAEYRLKKLKEFNDK